MAGELPAGYGLFVVRRGVLAAAPELRCERRQLLQMLLDRLGARSAGDPEGFWVVAELAAAGRRLEDLTRGGAR